MAWHGMAAQGQHFLTYFHPTDLQNQIITPEGIKSYIETSLPGAPKNDVGVASYITVIRPNDKHFKTLRLGYKKMGMFESAPVLESLVGN
jgi:hypothetical protein